MVFQCHGSSNEDNVYSLLSLNKHLRGSRIMQAWLSKASRKVQMRRRTVVMPSWYSKSPQ